MLSGTRYTQDNMARLKNRKRNVPTSTEERAQSKYVPSFGQKKARLDKAVEKPSTEELIMKEVETPKLAQPLTFTEPHTSESCQDTVALPTSVTLDPVPDNSPRATMCSKEDTQISEGYKLLFEAAPLSCKLEEHSTGNPELCSEEYSTNQPISSSTSSRDCLEGDLTSNTALLSKGDEVTVNSPLDTTTPAAHEREELTAALPLPQSEPKSTSAMQYNAASPDSNQALQGIITELSLLNEYILKSRRELEAASRHYNCKTLQ